MDVYPPCQNKASLYDINNEWNCIHESPITVTVTDSDTNYVNYKYGVSCTENAWDGICEGEVGSLSQEYSPISWENIHRTTSDSISTEHCHAPPSIHPSPSRTNHPTLHVTNTNTSNHSILPKDMNNMDVDTMNSSFSMECMNHLDNWVDIIAPEDWNE